MADAPMQDRLDAVWAAESCSTILKKSGEVRVIGYPYQENIPNMDINAMFARESWLKANADAAKRFRTVFTRTQVLMAEPSGPSSSPRLACRSLAATSM